MVERYAAEDGTAMRDYTTWMQSRFYNSAFNSAIFDGPIRIYFAQLHEPLALKIYFGLQQRFEMELKNSKAVHRQSGVSVCVLLYPNRESFEQSFSERSEFIQEDSLGKDKVIAIRGPFEDHDLEQVLGSIATELRGWKMECDEPRYPIAIQA